MQQPQFPFSLSFEPVGGVPGPWMPECPAMALACPQWGWMDWRVAWAADGFTAHVSYLSDWSHVWAWMAALAHGLCPITLWLDEEGSRVALSAQWHDESRNVIHLTLRRLSDDELPVDLARFDWLDNRSRWLVDLGRLLADRMADFPSRHWGYSSQLWLPIEACLPWQWPGQACLADGCGLPSGSVSQRQGWFFLLLASDLQITQAGERLLCASAMPKPLLGAARARLKYQEMVWQANALSVAQRLLGLSGAASGEEPYRPWCKEVAGVFEDVDCLCVEVTDWENLGDGLPQEPPMDLLSLEAAKTYEFSFRLSRWLEDIKPRVIALMGVPPGSWLRDESGRPGRVLRLHRLRQPSFDVAAEPDRGTLPADGLAGCYVLVDWGQNGIARERDFLGALHWGRLQWPVLSPDDFRPGAGEVHEHWLGFALHPVTATCHAICPCCGYPHLEDDDPIELLDCPLCGWGLSGAAAWSVHLPTEPNPGDRAAVLMSTLDECRARVQAHGDVFPLCDTPRAAWWRRPDVVTLRAAIRKALDEWLEAPEPKPALPLSDWETLDWSARQVEAPLYRGHVPRPVEAGSPGAGSSDT